LLKTVANVCGAMSGASVFLLSVLILRSVGSKKKKNSMEEKREAIEL